MRRLLLGFSLFAVLLVGCRNEPPASKKPTIDDVEPIPEVKKASFDVRPR